MMSKIFEKLLKICPEIVIGEYTKFEAMLYNLYDSSYDEKMIIKEQKRNLLKCLSVVLLGFLFIILLYMSNEEEKIPQTIGIMCIILCVFCSTKYNNLKEQIKKNRETILYEFPDFVNALLLKLNSGAVLKTSLTSIIEDYKKSAHKKKLIYDEFSKILDKANRSGESETNLISKFAVRTGSKEIIRFANMIKDNIEKGIDISQKLEQEESLLFELRKRVAKQKGEKAESKLVIPMTMLLLVILIITMAPVVMIM